MPVAWEDLSVMIRNTVLKPALLAMTALTAMSACGGGGGSSPTVSTPPPPPVSEPAPAPTSVGAEKGCAARTKNANASRAIAAGDASLATMGDLFSDVLDVVTCTSADHDSVKRALFNLAEDGAVTADSLTSISWDPTHDTGLLIAGADAGIVLRSNAVTRDGYEVQSAGLAVAGTTGEARHLVMGSNPMRNIHRGASPDGMDAFLKNAVAWLSGRDDLDTGTLNVVIAQMDQSYYFPDQNGTRAWLDVAYDTRVIYNEAAACDGAALAGCLADNPDLLIISQVGEDDGVSAAVEAALARGQAVLYLHHDGDLKPLGASLISMLGANYAGDNYWRRQSMVAFDGTANYGDLSDEAAALETLLTNLRDDSFAFDLLTCEDKSCPDGHAYNTDFQEPAQNLKSRIDGYDRSATDVFQLSGHRLDKGLVLLADKFREDVTYPMDKVATLRGDFLRSMFADHVVHTARSSTPVQADLGNFSRSDFTGTSLTNKTVDLTARRHYSAAGVYAVPGQTVRVTRLDDSDVGTHIRINLVRSGATHEFETNGYKRPKYLSSQDMPIAPGETLTFTSPLGGPIQVRFDGKDVETQFRFEGVGEHAVWRGPEDDADFEAKLDAGTFDWAELITPGFQVHSTLEKMRETVNHPVWPSAAQVAEATQYHLHNLPHVLAGLKGDGIDVVPEIHDFAAANGLEIYTLDTVKHMNADQATCGYGCSGNPYDAYWDFNPIGHGDIHELGHGLERSRFLYAGQPGHTGTNPYSYFSKSEFFKETSNTSDLGCQNLPYQNLFETVQASRNAADPAQYMRDQNLTNWSDGAAINLQIMMAAQDLGLLENGYFLLARQHIIDREFNLADNNDTAWAEKKDGLGFGAFTREEARALTNNDWNLIALSHALDRDMSNYLELWGFELSESAKAAVAEKVNFPTDFYVADSQAHCTGFPTEKRPVDGAQLWPLSGKPMATKFSRDDAH